MMFVACLLTPQIGVLARFGRILGSTSYIIGLGSPLVDFFSIFVNH
jgi:hypothetical protein